MTPDTVIDRGLNRKKLRLPRSPRVEEIRWYPYIDWLGDESLRIWVVIEETKARNDSYGKGRGQIEDAIRAALRKAGVREFAYINFATAKQIAKAGIQV